MNSYLNGSGASMPQREMCRREAVIGDSDKIIETNSEKVRALNKKSTHD
jgi:hypothetical protein